MPIQDNPNIIRITGAVKEYNGRTILGRNGVDDTRREAGDDTCDVSIWHDQRQSVRKRDRLVVANRIHAKHMSSKVAYVHNIQIQYSHPCHAHAYKVFGNGATERPRANNQYPL